MKIDLYIPFDPVPWAAPKLSKTHCYDPREKDKRAIRYLIKEQYNGPIYDIYVAIQFTFQFPIPKSATKSMREAMLGKKIFPTKCDCTNLQKLYEDCLKKIVIEDDRKVVITSSAKYYGEFGSVVMVVQDYEGFFKEHTRGIENEIKKRKESEKSNA